MIGKRVNSENEVAFLNQEIAWMEWPTTSIVTKPSLLFVDPCSLDSRRSASANGKIGGSHSLRKQPTFRDITTGLPAKWRLRNECRNSILTCHYPDVAGWSKFPANKISVVTRHRYGISAHVSQTLFRGETSVGVVECRLFSQGRKNTAFGLKQ